MRFRAFIAVDVVPNDALVSVLRDLQRCRADLKIVRSDLLHVTLKFLGDTEESLVEEITRRMADAAKRIQPFEIRLTGMGAFPSMSNIRVIWVGIEDGRELAEIAKELEASLDELGFQRDRRGFAPHLTIARTRSTRNIASVQELLRRNAASAFGTYRIDRILLKKSVLSPQGPTYSVVSEHLLK